MTNHLRFLEVATLMLLSLSGVPARAGFVTLDDPDPLQMDGTYALGVSGSTVVGYWNDRFSQPHGFTYSGGNYSTLDDPLGAKGTAASGVSGNSIVGYYIDSSTAYHGFSYDGASYTTLNDPFGVAGTAALGVNGNTIVGNYYDGAHNSHGFIYDTIHSNYTTLDDPLASGLGTFATGVSSGTIVGYYYNASGTHGFSYNGANFTTLDDPLGLKQAKVEAVLSLPRLYIHCNIFSSDTPYTRVVHCISIRIQ